MVLFSVRYNPPDGLAFRHRISFRPSGYSRSLAFSEKTQKIATYFLTWLCNHQFNVRFFKEVRILTLNLTKNMNNLGTFQNWNK